MERISQSVRHEDCLGFSGLISYLQLVNTGIERDRVDIDEDWNAAVLHDRCHGRGEPGGRRDDFVTGPDAAVAELVAGQSRKGEQVGLGT